MMRFLLDTNAVIAVPNDPHGRVSLQLRRHAPREVGLSAVALHELHFGAYKSRRRESNLTIIDGLRFEVVPFDQEDARHAGEIRATLAVHGLPIGGYDVSIAGQARARGLTLVTRNMREFELVDGLRAENWEADSHGSIERECISPLLPKS